MKWQSYPAYKDSGIEWMGKVPEYWDTTRVAFIFSQSNAGEVIDKSYWGDGDELLFTCSRHPFVSDFSEFPEGKRTSVKDLLLTRNGTPYVHKPPDGAIYSNVIQRITLKRGWDRDFCSYALSNSCLGLKGYGVSIESLNFEMWKSLRLTIPPLPEQRAIAAFLDHKTAHIDALIAKKERQIELLQEKRAALISHAVTKGLDPSVPMKDSGIEWLGEIPAHWEMKRLKHVISFVTSGSRGWAQYYSDSGDVFLRMGNLNRDSIDLDLSEIQHVRPPSGTEGERTQVRPNDILISITAYVGTVGLVPNGLGKAYVNQHTALLRPRHKQVNARWLAYCISSTVVQPQFATTEIGGTKVGIGLDDLRDITLVYPSLGEQETISIHLDSQISRIVRSIAKVQESIATLREYHTALISAAVTGKIDVRSEQVQRTSESALHLVAR